MLEVLAMDNFIEEMNNLIKYLQNQSYKILNGLYFLYQFAWLALNLIILINGQFRKYLLVDSKINFLNLIIADIIMFVIISSLQIMFKQNSFFILNLIGIAATMLIVPYFTVIHTITLIMMTGLFAYNLFLSFSLPTFYDNSEDEEGDDNDDYWS